MVLMVPGGKVVIISLISWADNIGERIFQTCRKKAFNLSSWFLIYFVIKAISNVKNNLVS